MRSATSVARAAGGLAVALLLAASPAPVAAASPDPEGRRGRFDDLLARMTLEEKVGQLCQYAGGRSISPNSRIDDSQRQRIREGRVGSYLHVAGAEPLRELQRLAVEESRLGIPLLFALDVVHGLHTILPVPLAAASSWDPEIVEAAARQAAVEATAAGLHWTFAPMIDTALDPRWGRIVEGAGEDPYLGAVMAAAQVRGFQGDDLAAADTILACPKHYVAYGAAVGGRDYNSADVSDRDLHELYLPPFRAAVAAGAGSLMTGFNDVAGVPMTVHRSLIEDTLRGAWGFDGMIVSDWNAIGELLNHGVVENAAAAARAALEAGVDMDMMSNLYEQTLVDSVRSGALPEAVVDAAVLRVLEAKDRLGLFDDPYRYGDPARERAVTLSAEHRAFAREIGRRSIVLLKNDAGVLPLSKSPGTLAVIGPLADDQRATLGSWKALGRPEDAVSVLAGIREAVAEGTRVTHAVGCGVKDDDRSGIDAAVRLASEADAVVLVIGEDADMSGEARSRSRLGLPGVQAELAARVLATGKPVAVVLMNGRPLSIGAVAESAPAILETWLLGTEMGHAVADVLFGDVSPAGRLPVSVPRHVGQVPLSYRHRNTGRPYVEGQGGDTSRYFDLDPAPLFPFGHGLSYTRFEYAALSVTPSAQHENALDVAFTLTNTGARPGDEVAQLYVRDPVAGVARPVLELKGFVRVGLAPGESRRVTFTLPTALLAFSDASGHHAVEAGRLQVRVGASSDDLRLSHTHEIATSFSVDPVGVWYTTATISAVAP